MTSSGPRALDDAGAVLEDLRGRGYRMTPQRRAIVEEVMRATGHISPGEIAARVQRRLPGVNASTVYRTLELLEEVGAVHHAHMEDGAEYHRASHHDHVHLVCSRCGRSRSLPAAEVAALERALAEATGFHADLTHFAIAGLCAECAAAVERGA